MPIHLDPWTDIVGVNFGNIGYVAAVVTLVSHQQRYGGFYHGDLGEGSCAPVLEDEAGPDGPLTSLGIVKPNWTNFWIDQYGHGYNANIANPLTFSINGPSTPYFLTKYTQTGSPAGSAEAPLTGLPIGFLNTPGYKSVESVYRPDFIWPWSPNLGGRHPRAKFNIFGQHFTTQLVHEVSSLITTITSSPDTCYGGYPGGIPNDLGKKWGIVNRFGSAVSHQYNFANTTTSLNIGGTVRTFRCTGTLFLNSGTAAGPFDNTGYVFPFISSNRIYLLLEREDLIT